MSKGDQRMRRAQQAQPAFRAEPVLRPRQQVEKQIKQAILDGIVTQGERLPSEARLAEQFAVSRATVREALRSLAENGLITKSPGSQGGSFVDFVDHHALSGLVSDRLASTLRLGSITYEEVAEFRDLLEIPSARLAAKERREEHLEALHDIIEQEKNITVDDPKVPQLNAQFHSSLAEASGNRLLAAFVAALHSVAHPLAFIDTSPEVGRQAVRHHIAIYSAVNDRSPETAAEAMQQHLEYLRKHAA